MRCPGILLITFRTSVCPVIDVLEIKHKKKQAFFHVLVNLKNYQGTIINPNKKIAF